MNLRRFKRKFFNVFFYHAIEGSPFTHTINDLCSDVIAEIVSVKLVYLFIKQIIKAFDYSKLVFIIALDYMSTKKLLKCEPRFLQFVQNFNVKNALFAVGYIVESG